MKSVSKKAYLISDSTGELGERFIRAIFTQFPHNKFQFRRFNFVENEDDLALAFSKISDGANVIFHTVMAKALKQRIAAIARGKNIPSFDLTGPATDFMIQSLHVRPVWDLTAVHRVTEDYESRIQAIEYTIEHDDGAGARSLDAADVILIGPSRSSKTPTSIFLAIRGYRVANIPLIRSLPVSEDLLKLRGDDRVIGFVIDPQKLVEVREKRVEELGSRVKGYVEMDTISKEIKWVRELYRQYGWKKIDVTDRAIEETAAIVMRSLPRKSEWRRR